MLYYKNPDIIIEHINETDNSLLVYNAFEEKYHVLNNTAGSILLVCTNKTISEIQSSVFEKFVNVEFEDIKEDVSKILLDFIKNSLVFIDKS